MGDADARTFSVTKLKPVVCLIHGIRTHADWYNEVRNTLIEAGFEVRLISYGRFDLFRFLFPFPLFRRKVQAEVLDQIRDVRMQFPDNPVSIIAHSFGTYVISQALKSGVDLRVERLFLAGCVIHRRFPFRQITERFKGQIINEVATRDPFPPLACSVTTGYGSTGTFGFKNPQVFDRWHNCGHSDVLTPEFCEEFWIPALYGQPPQPTPTPSRTPLIIQLIDLIKVKYLVLLFMLLILLLNLPAFKAKRYEYQAHPGKNGWTLGSTQNAQFINMDMDLQCPVSNVFGSNLCNTSLIRWKTGRRWYGVDNYDHALNTVRFPDAFQFSGTDPLAAWEQLQAEYPDCVELKRDGYAYDITLGTDCALPRE